MLTKRNYLLQGTLIEDNDTSLQFLPRKATVALMFHCLYVASSVQAVGVIEGKMCGDRSFSCTKVYRHLFSPISKTNEVANYLYNDACSQMTPFYQVCVLLYCKIDIGVLLIGLILACVLT